MTPEGSWQRQFLFLQGPSSPIFRKIADRLEALGHSCLRINLNVGDQIFWRRKGAFNYRGTAADWPGYLETFIARHGVPDIVIANAGVSFGTLSEHHEDFEVIRRIFETNVFGMIATFMPFIAGMQQAARQGKACRLVGIASVAGIRGLPGAEAYSASKAATISYLESLRVELRESGVKVVTIAPGYIETPMTAINPYPMPFLLPVKEAARRFARAIDQGSSYVVIPWQMGIVAKVLRLLPNGLYDRLFANVQRKPRVF